MMIFRGLLIVLAVALATGAQAATYTYTAVIDQSQEVPPTGALGIGVGLFTIDDVSGLVTWDVNYVNLTGQATAAHIHAAAPGFNGGPVIDLDLLGTVSGVGNGQTFGSLEGSANMLGMLPVNLFAPDWYINIHTAANPGGEIRGDLVFAAVPVPAALWMLGSGLLALVGVRRRAS